jgi:hypothetical protein
MADTTGLEQSMMPHTRSRASVSTRLRTSRSDMISSSNSKLPPAENPLPAPRISATRVSGSRSITRHTSARLRWASASTALRPGASNVSRSTPSEGRSTPKPLKLP